MTSYCPFCSHPALSPSAAPAMYQVTRTGEEYSAQNGYHQVWQEYHLQRSNHHPTPDYQAQTQLHPASLFTELNVESLA